MSPRFHAAGSAILALIAWPAAFFAAIVVLGSILAGEPLFYSLPIAVVAAFGARRLVLTLMRMVPARCACNGKMWRIASRPILYRCASCGTSIAVSDDVEAAEDDAADRAAEERVARELAQASPEAGALSEPTKPDGALSKPQSGELSTKR